MSHIIVEVSIPANFTVVHIDYTREWLRANQHFFWFNDLLSRSYAMKFTRFMDFITDTDGYIISQSQDRQRIYYTIYLPKKTDETMEQNDINVEIPT